MLGPEDLCRRGRSCPRRLTFAGAGVAAPGVVTVAGAGVVAPGSLRPPKCEPRRSGRRLPPVPSPARISASPVWALHSCAGVTHGPGMCGHPLRGRDAWPRRKIPARALRMAPGMLQLCVSAMWHKCCARPAQDPALPHSASSQSDARPSQLQRETTLRADRPVSGLGSTRSGWLAHSTQLHAVHRPTASRYTTRRHPARNSPAPRITGGPGYRLTGPDWETSPCGCDVPL